MKSLNIFLSRNLLNTEGTQLLHFSVYLDILPVGHSSNHEYQCCQLKDNRAVFRIFIALLRFSFDSPSYFTTSSSILIGYIAGKY